MSKKDSLLFTLCIFFVIIKLVSIFTTNFNLYGDEAQYWLWSKDLSLGYFSKPPLLSWLVFIITFIFGDSFFVLKCIPIFLYCLSSYLIFVFSKILFNSRSLAFYCAVTFFLLPSVSFSSFLLSTDVVLILFWIAGLIQILKIKETPSNFNFFLLGLFLGLAFLSKYAAIYFVISLILLLIFEKNYNYLFFKHKKKFSLALIVFLLILLPNIYWNYYHGWITLSHVGDNASLDNIKINFFELFKFILSQILMIGPILFFTFLFFYKKITLNNNDKILLFFSLPTLIIVMIESLLVRAHANWAAVSLVTLSIFFVSFVYKQKKEVIYFNNYINLFIGFIFFILVAFSFPFAPFNRIGGIKDLVVYLEEKNFNNIKNIAISDRMLFANLSYEYLGQNVNFYSPYAPKDKVGNHFQLKNPLAKNFEESFLLIGNISDVDYLNKNKTITVLGSEAFTFSDKKIEIYEVKLD